MACFWRYDRCEIYVKKIPSIKITDIAKAIAPEAKQEIIGIRPGEKLHEEMISSQDSYSTFDYPGYFKILPQINDWRTDTNRIKDGKKVPDNFVYSSDLNSIWMTKRDLQKWIEAKLN